MADDDDEHERHLVVEILNAEQLDAIERSLVPLLRDDEVRLLRPLPREDHAEIITSIEQLPWLADPNAAAGDAYSLLVEHVDPRDDDADVPWCLAIVKLAACPQLGSRLARRWFVHLFRARLEDRPVSVVGESTAALAVAACEGLLRRPYEVARWMRTSAVVAEHDERTALGVALYVRGSRLLEPLLRLQLGPAR
jgi:hypothetical protein